MKTATILLCKEYTVAKTDDRLFGSFVEHMGATVYNGIYQPGHARADENGFRQDVIELVKQLGLSMIRYPGGNFVSGFRWEDSVGPRGQRPTKLDLAWKAIEPNSFGLNEFMQWMKMISCEPIMTVNLGTRGPQDAAKLVEYCNFPGGSEYSELRRSHGIAEPYGIKTWCLGNELDGPWQIAAKTAKEYGRVACEAGKLMKWIDPDIELVAVGSSTSRMESFPKWDKDVLMHTYEVVDYISLHHYMDRMVAFSPLSSVTVPNDKRKFHETAEYLARSIYVDRQIHDIIAVCDYIRALKRSDKTMYLSFDEWNVVAPKKHDGMEFQQWQTGSPIDCGEHSMVDALAFASMMMSIIRRADRIKIACQSLLVNTGPLIVAPKDGLAFRNTIFYPFSHISQYGRGTILQAVVNTPSYATESFHDVPVLDPLAVYDEQKQEITLFIVNRDSQPIQICLDTAGFGTVRIIEHICMSCEDINSSNIVQNPNQVIPYNLQCRNNSPALPGYSWNVIRLKADGIHQKNKEVHS